MIETNNLAEVSIDEHFLKKIAQNVLKEEKKSALGLSIALVKPKEIQKLNQAFLKKDRVTDVLAFPQQELNSLGEVIICPKKVKDNAQQFKVVFEKELSRVLIHGILHLLGYEHEKSDPERQKMKVKEDYYLEKYF